MYRTPREARFPMYQSAAAMRLIRAPASKKTFFLPAFRTFAITHPRIRVPSSPVEARKIDLNNIKIGTWSIRFSRIAASGA
jgi:hypothetical protein